MKPARLTVFAALCLAVLIFVVWDDRNTDSKPGSGDLLFPNLLDELNEVTEITVATSDKVFQIEMLDGEWVVPEYHGYPADGGNVRQALIGMAQIRKIDAATSDPNQYAQLGVRSYHHASLWPPMSNGVNLHSRTKVAEE